MYFFGIHTAAFLHLEISFNILFLNFAILLLFGSLSIQDGVSYLAGVGSPCISANGHFACVFFGIHTAVHSPQEISFNILIFFFFNLEICCCLVLSSLRMV